MATTILDHLNDAITTAAVELEAARKASQRVAELENEVARLEAAKKALTAPQTPAGRKRIGDGQRKRRKKADPVAAQAEPVAICVECGEPGANSGCVSGHATMPLHWACMGAHDERMHAGAE